MALTKNPTCCKRKTEMVLDTIQPICLGFDYCLLFLEKDKKISKNKFVTKCVGIITTFIFI